MKQLLVIAMLCAVLVFAGCQAQPAANQEHESAPVVAHVVKTQQAPAQNQKTSVNSKEEVELYLTNGGFSPAVIEAKPGQDVTVISYITNDGDRNESDTIHFAIPELSIEEPLGEADIFSFKAPAKGEYTFMCRDCSPMLKGILLVE